MTGCNSTDDELCSLKRQNVELQLRLLTAETLIKVAASYADEPNIPIGLKMYAQDCKKYLETLGEKTDD